MQVDKTTENFADLNKKINITIKGDRLKSQQFFHALVINLIPLVGTIAAITIGLRSGIGILEISLLISLYSLTFIGITVGFHRPALSTRTLVLLSRSP
jgi:stearoyl-CoA desaturase (Delta-9 desaturase)